MGSNGGYELLEGQRNTRAYHLFVVTQINHQLVTRGHTWSRRLILNPQLYDRLASRTII